MVSEAASVKAPGRSTFEGVQTLRFVAAALVLVTHTTFYASERLTHGVGFWPYGASGVNIFFVISGFVMVASTRSWRDRPGAWKVFMWRRVLRIVPMYWLATTLKLSAMLAVPSLVLHARFDFGHVLSSYLFVPTKNIEGELKPLLAVGWTLYFEMFFYVVFAIAMAVRVQLYAFVGAVLVTCSVLSVWVSGAAEPWAMFFDPIVLQFFAGMLLAAAVTRRPRQLSPSATVVIAVLGVVSLALLLSPYRSSYLPETLRTGGLSTAVVAATIWLEPNLHGRVPRALLFLGDASYVLYLFHPLLVPIVPLALSRVGIHSLAVCVALGFGLAVVMATFVHLAFERPVTRWLRALRPER
jgi:exopolysaccharide production protein ExoZ